MAVLKSLFKDKIPAKPKFYGLLLLKEFMDHNQPQIVEYFIKKLLS